MFPQFQRYHAIGSVLAGWMDSRMNTSAQQASERITKENNAKPIAEARGVEAGTAAFVAAKGLDPVLQQNAYNVAYDKAYNEYMASVGLSLRSNKAGSTSQIAEDIAAAERIAAEKLASDAAYQEFLKGQKAAGQPATIAPVESSTMAFLKKYGLYLALGGGLLAILIIKKKMAAKKAS